MEAVFSPGGLTPPFRWDKSSEQGDQTKTRRRGCAKVGVALSRKTGCRLTKFLRKWRSLCAEVARSLEEAGDHILSFYGFPKAMWKSLRTTNPIENLNREFRRRTKTQGSFSTEDSALTLLWGLIAFGQIRMRKIDGHQHVSTLLATAKPKAA